jgi:transglutaminase-like putative cysteine protease
MLSLVEAAESPPPGTAIHPLGPWVEPLRAPLDQNPDTNAVDGVRVALLDEQINASSSEFYRHVVRELVNENGVQNGARIVAQFDPSYQSLAWHHVSLYRQDKVINCLDPAKIKVLQMETDLERHIYNGTLSAIIFVEDARLGDFIDFAYTVRGFNPILKGRMVDAFFLQYAVPVRQLRHRILWPAEKRLFFTSHGDDIKPAIHSTGGMTEFTWTRQQIPALAYEEDCPIWANPYPWVQVSDCALWSEVVDWAIGLYPKADGLPDALSEKIEVWRKIPDREEAIRAALEFVQDEIRYLGIEAGTGSHLPSSPGEVFSRRFGDCKDKTYLLVTILQQLGIKAVPVLVNTVYREWLLRFIPSPVAFNHVIARVEVNGRRLYLDPTRSLERGPVRQRNATEFAYCLPIESGIVSLESMGEPERPGSISIDETFGVFSKASPAVMTVVTAYSGRNADYERAFLAAITREELQKRALAYYARIYPKVQSHRPMEVHDDTQINVIRISEFYSIPGFWRPGKEDKKRSECQFYPSEINAALKRPSASPRTKPWLLNHPLQLTLRTRIQLPENWPADSKTWGNTNAGLEFAAERRATGREILMRYEVRTRATHVSATEIAQHAELVDSAVDSLGYTLFWGDPKTGGGPPNWPVIGFAVCFAGFTGFAAIYAYRRLGPALPPAGLDSPGMQGAPQGIGGWLLLVALAVVLRPLILAATLFSFSAAFRAELWTSLTSKTGGAYHPLWAPVLLFDLTTVLALLGFTILMAVLFFQKRSAFPRFYVALLIAFVVTSTIDVIFVGVLPSMDTKTGRETARALVSSLVACAVWIPYMFTSRRVKATFTR